ncbi:MAG TPA: hypothetical protein VF680_17395 [Allosphingosinicella sp.]|jgi:hypothetical protein
MADRYDATVDAGNLQAAMLALGTKAKESLARRMLVEGGVLLRNAAQVRAAVSRNKENEPARGVVAKAIYLAQNERETKNDIFTYSISWNATIAPHGHLIEFGHWRTHAVYKAANGQWYTRKDIPLAKPVWVAARPFLRPAFDNYGSVALRKMMDRGKRELPALIRECSNGV